LSLCLCFLLPPLPYRPMQSCSRSRNVNATPHVRLNQNGKSIPVALIQYDATTDRGGNSLLDTLRGYFVRYRLALYLFSGAAVALGVVLNWNWLTAAGLLRVVAVLPCALMMFRCMRHGTRRSDEETALLHGALPSRVAASSDPQQ